MEVYIDLACLGVLTCACLCVCELGLGDYNNVIIITIITTIITIIVKQLTTSCGCRQNYLFANYACSHHD